MSIQAVAWALEQDVPNSGMKLVLIALANRAEKDTGECYPSLRRLEREASMSRRSVQRHLQTLWREGFIEVGKSWDSSGRQMANSYRIIFDEDERQAIAAHHQEQDPATAFSGEGANLTPSPDGAADREQARNIDEGGCQSGTGEGDAHVTPEGDTTDTPKK